MEKVVQPGESRLRQLLWRLLSWSQGKLRKEPDLGELEPPLEPPEDPYAYVGAPKKPRPYNRGAAAVAELPEA
jgi:hypothetical protein